MYNSCYTRKNSVSPTASLKSFHALSVLYLKQVSRFVLISLSSRILCSMTNDSYKKMNLKLNFNQVPAYRIFTQRFTEPVVKFIIILVSKMLIVKC